MRYFTLALVALIAAIVACGGGNGTPDSSNMGEVEAARKVFRFLEVDTTANLAEVGLGDTALVPHECHATGFDKGAGAWRVDCRVSRLIDGEVTATVDMSFLVDDQTGAINTDG